MVGAKIAQDGDGCNVSRQSVQPWDGYVGMMMMGRYGTSTLSREAYD